MKGAGKRRTVCPKRLWGPMRAAALCVALALLAPALARKSEFKLMAGHTRRENGEGPRGAAHERAALCVVCLRPAFRCEPSVPPASRPLFICFTVC